MQPLQIHLVSAQNGRDWLSKPTLLLQVLALLAECTLCALFMVLSFLFPIHLIFVCLALSSILLISGSHCGIRSVAVPRISGSFL